MHWSLVHELEQCKHSLPPDLVDWISSLKCSCSYIKFIFRKQCISFKTSFEYTWAANWNQSIFRIRSLNQVHTSCIQVFAVLFTITTRTSYDANHFEFKTLANLMLVTWLHSNRIFIVYAKTKTLVFHCKM